MKIFLTKNVEKIGLAGEIVKVPDGFARNFIIPRGFGVEITKKNEASFAKRVRVVAHRKEVLESETSMLAEKIRSLTLKIKKKTHDDGKLYGAVSSSEIADALSKHGISVTKNKVLFNKSIKTKGSHKAIIKLSARLQPELIIEVVPE